MYSFAYVPQSQHRTMHCQNPETACQSQDRTANLEIAQYVCVISKLHERNSNGVRTSELTNGRGLIMILPQLDS